MEQAALVRPTAFLARRTVSIASPKGVVFGRPDEICPPRADRPDLLSHRTRMTPGSHQPTSGVPHHMSTPTVTAPQVAINDIGSAEDFLAAIDLTIKYFNDGDI